MMKRFKFGLVGIVLGLFGLTCFSSAGSYIYTGTVNFPGVAGSNKNAFIIPIVSDNYPQYFDISAHCDFTNVDFSGYSSVKLSAYTFGVSQFGSSFGRDIFTVYLENNLSVDFIFNDTTRGYPYLFYFYFKGTYSDYPILFNYSCTFTGNNLINLSSCGNGGGQSCPEINTGDILSGSCDTNYCVENDLCPVPSNFSQLFINEIEHQSAPLINITIPEEYSWDSSVDSGQFDLVISGQNVDYEYIDGIIRTQKFTPDEEDFNNIITQVIPLLVPGLVIILFIWFIFRFIKKLF